MKNIKALMILAIQMAFTGSGDLHDEPANEDIECDEQLGFQYECGPVCQNTCDPLSLFCQDAPKDAPCIPGCYCKDGLVLHRSAGRCVEEEMCETTCPADMEYKECGMRSCAPTCRRPNVTEQCNRSTERCAKGCYCKTGMVMDTLAGKCVYFDECTKECPQDMVYDICGPVFPRTCFPMPYNEVYPKECVSGCVCREGYALHQHKCLRYEECPKMSCPPDMVFQDCITDCPPTCRYRSSIINCFKECVKGCVCKTGLVYDKKLDKCVEVEKCKDLCPENMVYDECASACPATCSDPKPETCDKACKQDCRCIEGLVLDVQKQKCVMPADCEEDCPFCPRWIHGSP